MADGAAYRLQDSLQVPFADIPEPAWCEVRDDDADCETQPRAREKRPYGMRPLAGIDESVLAEMTAEELLGLRDKVEAYIRGHTFNRTRIPGDVRRIINIAAERAEISVLDIMSRRKSREIANARKVAMASTYALTNADGLPRFSKSRVGRLFRRDHTTAMYAINTVPDEELIRL